MVKQINARHCVERMTEGRDYHGQTGKDRDRERKLITYRMNISVFGLLWLL